MDAKNFSWLLVALLVFLIGAPIGDQLEITPTRPARALMFSWLLAVGVWSLRGFGAYFPVGIGLAIAGIVLNVLAISIMPTLLGYASMAAIAGFLLIAIWCTLTQIVPSTGVNRNRIVGAISLYLMLGVLWAVLYSATEMVQPGSFAGIDTIGSQGWTSDWLYFSFVTMTTLGYGDVTPTTEIARTLAYFQAIFGQFYIAILVAGLVGAYISNRDAS